MSRTINDERRRNRRMRLSIVLLSVVSVMIHRVPTVHSFHVSTNQHQGQLQRRRTITSTAAFNTVRRSSPSGSRLYVSSTTRPPTTSTSTTNDEEEEIVETTRMSAQFISNDIIFDTSNNSTISVVDVQEKSLLSKLYDKIGTIDESRYIFPEYTSGEVKRVFSKLNYQSGEMNKMTSVTHAAGSVASAIALIAGTTVGAGVLAIPAATVEVGFLPSTVAMLVAYGYMVVSGLLIAELTVNRMGTTGKPGTGLLDLYHNSLGTPMSQIGTGAYFFLHYAMMVAYIAQGGTNFMSLIPEPITTLLPPGAGQVLFATICGLGLYGASGTKNSNGNSNIVENVNNILVVGVVGTFFAIVASASGTANFNTLFDMQYQHPEHIVDCMPILFLSFVYQNVVPTVVTKLEGDRRKIIVSILGGTAIPLLMFIAWNAVILGNVLPSDGGASSIVDPIALLSSGALGNVAPLVTAFSLTAVTTSIIGFTYGLVEAWKDTFKNIQSSNNNGNRVTSTDDDSNWKTPLLFSLVFIPPLLVAITDPNIFYNALEYGGAFGVSTLFLILPPIMVWNERYGSDNKPLVTKPLVPFGKIPLGSMWKAAGTLILEQGAEKLGIFHWVQQQFL